MERTLLVWKQPLLGADLTLTCCMIKSLVEVVFRSISEIRSLRITFIFIRPLKRRLPLPLSRQTHSTVLYTPTLTPPNSTPRVHCISLDLEESFSPVPSPTPHLHLSNHLRGDPSRMRASHGQEEVWAV